MVGEDDYACPQLAQVLALQQEFCVRFESHEAWFVEGDDPRLANGEQLAREYEAAHGHWDGGTVVGHDALRNGSSAFHVPLLRMLGHKVEHDEAEGRGMGQSCSTAAARTGQSCELRRCRGFSALGCTAVLRTALHKTPHLLPFKVCWESSSYEAFYNSWARQAARETDAGVSKGGSTSSLAHHPGSLGFFASKVGGLTHLEAQSQPVPPLWACTALSIDLPETSAPATASRVVGPTPLAAPSQPVPPTRVRTAMSLATGLLAQSQPVPPLRASTATSIALQPVSKPLHTDPPPGAEVKLQSAASVEILPRVFGRPEVRQQQLSGMDWLSQWRAAGIVGERAQQDKFALFSTAHHLQIRPMQRGCTIHNLVEAVLEAVPRLRSCRVLVNRIYGLPAVQIAATALDDPADHFALPLDFREAGGRICTLPVQHACLDPLPAFALPHTNASKVGCAGIDGPSGFGNTDQGLSSVVAGPQQSDTAVPIALPGGAPSRHAAPSFIGDLQAMIASHIPLRPDWVQGPLLHMSPFEGRWLAAFFPDDPDRRCFTVFDCRLDLMRRTADPSWSTLDYVTAATRSVPYRVRLVWFVIRPIPDLPVPQLVLTAQDAAPGARAIPVDLRGFGGMIHTIELQPGPLQPIWPALRHKGVDPNGRLEQAWGNGACAFHNEQGQAVERLTIDGASPEWLQLVYAGPYPEELQVDYLGGPARTLSCSPTRKLYCCPWCR